MSDQSFSGRIALVTGASRGLGFAVARALCNRGATVFALARTLGGLEELDDLVKADGGTRPTLLPLDVTDDGAIERLGAAIHERHGHLDILVHCAAHAPPLAPVGHVAPKDLDKAWTINARAVQQLIRSLDPLLRASAGAKAVFMTDDRAGKAFWSAYAVSKDAGLGFARSYAAEIEKTDVEVIFHTPPRMQTALRARFYPGQKDTDLTSCADAAQKVLERL
jgi:NAD(P)-dependent dehydrogenase (short-subunit alcohol dehydrogenase family)